MYNDPNAALLKVTKGTVPYYDPVMKRVINPKDEKSFKSESSTIKKRKMMKATRMRKAAS